MSLSPKYLVAVNLVLLALVAYSASAIGSTALATRLLPPPDVELSEPPPPIPQEAAKTASHYALIHRRDIFNSAKLEAPPVRDEPARPTPLKLDLVGVALYENGSSYCVIYDQQTRKQGLFGIDEEVTGGATVKAVEWDRVILTRNGKDEILELKTSPAPAAPSRMTRAVSTRGQATGTDSGIQQTAENEFTIPREEVDNALENMSQLFTQIRAVPHFEGGQSTGFRLFAIRRGSLFDKIGLKNGDIIQRINGTEMNDPSRALALLDDLRDASDLTVDVIRNRQPQTLSYQVR